MSSAYNFTDMPFIARNDINNYVCIAKDKIKDVLTDTCKTASFEAPMVFLILGIVANIFEYVFIKLMIKNDDRAVINQNISKNIVILLYWHDIVIQCIVFKFLCYVFAIILMFMGLSSYG